MTAELLEVCTTIRSNILTCRLDRPAGRHSSWPCMTLTLTSPIVSNRTHELCTQQSVNFFPCVLQAVRCLCWRRPCTTFRLRCTTNGGRHTNRRTGWAHRTQPSLQLCRHHGPRSLNRPSIAWCCTRRPAGELVWLALHSTVMGAA